MEMSVFFYWFLVSCFVIYRVQNSEGKTVSLNELIAAESRRSEATEKVDKTLDDTSIHHSSSHKDQKDISDSRPTSKASKEIISPKNKLYKTPKSAALHNKIPGSPIKRLLGKKNLLRGVKGTNKFKGLLSDLESEASDIIKILRKKASTKTHNEEAKSSGKLEESEPLSLNKLLFRDPKKPREFQITELITPQGKKLLSSLKYRKRFHIKSPLKARKVRHQRLRQKRKNQSVKRQVNYGRFDRQYIPLLRSLSMLFDNVLDSGSDEIDKAARESYGEHEDMASASTNIVQSGRQRSRKNKGNKQAGKLPFFRNGTTYRYRSTNKTDDRSKEDDKSNENTRSQGLETKENSTSSEDNRKTETIVNDKGNRTKAINKESAEGEDSDEGNKRKGDSCSCTSKTSAGTEKSKTGEEAITTTAIPEISNETVQVEATAASADNTSNGNFSSLRSDTDIPLLPPGNTTSSRGNLTGLGEGSGPALHRSVKGNITRDHRDSEHNSRSGEDKSDAADDEADSDGVGRGSSNGGRPRGDSGDSGEIRSPVYRGHSYEVEETQVVEEIDTRPGHTQETHAQVIEKIFSGPERIGFEGEDNVETGGDEAESTTVLPESVRQLGGRFGEDRVGNQPESVQSKEAREESIDGVFKSIPSYKRFPVRNGTSSAEAEETGTANETITGSQNETMITGSEDETTITLEDLADPVKMLRASPKGKAPYVTIIDGYSVARDINGKNKLSEHSVRFHS